MSGGHFDYKCFAISGFADELLHEIELNESVEKDCFGYDVGLHYSEETMRRLTLAHQLITIAGKLAREVEWLYSGDHGEESFCRLFDEILEEN